MSARSELARVHVVQLLTSFEKEMWSFFLCQLPTSENRLTFELTDCRLVYVLYPSLALPKSVNRRPTTLANTSTQNSKIYNRFSLFYDLSTKRLWKSNLRAKTTYHHSKILLILWHAKLLRSERSAGSEMASGDVVQLSTGFEKETSNSSPGCETGAGAAAIGTQMSRLRPNFQTLRTDCLHACPPGNLLITMVKETVILYKKRVSKNEKKSYPSLMWKRWKREMTARLPVTVSSVQTWFYM